MIDETLIEDGKIEKWKCNICGRIIYAERSPITTSNNNPMPIGGWGCNIDRNKCRGEMKIIVKEEIKKITKEELKELVENSLRVALIKSHLTFLVQKEDFRMINIYSDGGIMVTFFGHCGAEDDEIDIEFEDLNKTDEQLKQEVETERLRKEEETEKDIEIANKIDEEIEYKKIFGIEGEIWKKID